MVGGRLALQIIVLVAAPQQTDGFQQLVDGAQLCKSKILFQLRSVQHQEVFTDETMRTKRLDYTRVVTAKLPEGTTHYLINLIDENNFLRSYPEVTRIKDGKNYSEQAIAKQP